MGVAGTLHHMAGTSAPCGVGRFCTGECATNCKWPTARCGPGVVLNEQISGARDVTKTNTSNTDTFRNWELGFMGYMRDGVPHFYRVSTRKNTVETEFDVSGTAVLPQVDIVYGYVNMNVIAVDAFVAAGTKAIIYAGVGEGTVADSGIEPALIEARKKGVIVVRSSRVGNGLVTRSTENRDDELG